MSAVELTEEDDEKVAVVTRAVRQALLANGGTTLRERVVEHEQHVTLEFTDFGTTLAYEHLEEAAVGQEALLQRARLILPTHLHCGSVPMRLEFDVTKSEAAVAAAATPPYVHTAHTQTLPFSAQTASATRAEKATLQSVILYVTNMTIDMPVSEVEVLENDDNFVICLNHLPTLVRLDFVRALKQAFSSVISRVVFESSATAKNEIQIELLRTTRKRKQAAAPPPPVKRQRKPAVPPSSVTPPPPPPPLPPVIKRSLISAITHTLGF